MPFFYLTVPVDEASRHNLARSSAQSLTRVKQSCWLGIRSHLGLGWGRIYFPVSMVVGSFQSVAIIELTASVF